MTFAALAEAASSFAQSGRGFDSRIFKDGNHADHQADEKRQTCRKKKYGDINTNFVQPGQSRRRRSDDQVQGAISEPQPDHAAYASQYQTLQKQARDDISPVGPQ